jgi:CrcB protein
MYTFVFIFLGGGLGSLCRYAFSLWLPARFFPWGTLWANTLSCLLLGIVLMQFSKTAIDEQQKLFLATGFCGGFSTFSTFSAEMLSLFQDGEQTQAFGYLLASLVLGIVAILLGMYLAKWL